MSNTPDLIGTLEACDLLGIERSTMTRWVQTSKIAPAMKLPGLTGAMLFRRADVEALASAPIDAA